MSRTIEVKLTLVLADDTQLEGAAAGLIGVSELTEDDVVHAFDRASLAWLSCALFDETEMAVKLVGLIASLA